MQNTSFYDRVSTANYIEILTGAHKRYGKFLLFLENVAHHKSKALEKLLGIIPCKDRWRD